MSSFGIEQASRHLHSLIDHRIMLILPKQNMMSSFSIEQVTSPPVALVAQSDASVASVAVAGNSLACVSQSSTLGSWVVDSSASDHISGNELLLSDIVYS